MTKKEIYAAYGIEFDGEKIAAPEMGKINPLLVNGNGKLGRGVWTWSTLAGTGLYAWTVDGKNYTTSGTCVCNCTGCYAQAGNYNFNSVKTALAVRTWLARNYLDFITRAIIAQIKADRIRIFRIHASGDFFSAAYIDAWREIATACPDTVFWSYTKNADAETAFNDISNVNIVKSCIPGIGFNFGHCDYIIDTYNKLKSAGKSVYICRCGVDPDQHCINCKGCSKNEYVLFIEHSTNYKAAADPLYPTLRAIVENQARPE